MRVFIVNKWVGNVFEFQGVFSDETKAVQACSTRNHCVCPAIMDQMISEDLQEWPGAYYPHRKEGV